MSEPLFASSCSAAWPRRSAPPVGRTAWRWALLAGAARGPRDPHARERDDPAARRSRSRCGTAGRGWSCRALAPPVALVVVAVARRRRRGRSATSGRSTTSCRSRPSSARRWRAPTTTTRERTEAPGVVALAAPGPLLPADLVRRARARRTRPCSRSDCAHRAERYALDHPTLRRGGRVLDDGARLDLGGLDWARHTASTVSIDSTWADARTSAASGSSRCSRSPARSPPRRGARRGSSGRSRCSCT